MRNHYVYYSYEDFGRGYIGSRTCNCSPEEDNYFGSFYDKIFTPTNKIILETFDNRVEALDAEIKLHQFYDVARNPHFANQAKQTSTGFSAEGVVRSEEYKKKMSERLKGREIKPEWIKKAVESRKGKIDGENNPFYGKTHTPETRKRIAESLSQTYKNEGNHPWIGKKHSEESKQKMREAHSGEKNHLYGKTQSEETKRKQSEARKLWWERKKQQQNEEA
jgi:hypothetical protein